MFYGWTILGNQVRLALGNGEFGWMEQAAVECQVPAGLIELILGMSVRLCFFIQIPEFRLLQVKTNSL